MVVEMVKIIKSLFRKNKGSSLFVFILLMVATVAATIGITIALNLDSYYVNKAKESNAPDIYIELCSSEMVEDENLYDDVKKIDGVSNLYEYEFLLPDTIEFTHHDSKSTTSSIFMNYDMEYLSLSPQLVEQMDKIPDKAVILPLQFKILYEYNIGDIIQFTIDNHLYKYTVYGFYEDILTGSNAMGLNKIYLFQEEYQNLIDADIFIGKAFYVFAENEKIDVDQLSTDISNLYNRFEPSTVSAIVITLASVRGNGLMFANLIALVFMGFAIIIIIISLISASYSIQNAIEESITEIGILKASGYITLQIRSAFLMQYLIISGIAFISGLLIASVLSEHVGNIIAQTICLYWDMKLDYMASLVVVLFILILILLVVYIGTRYARKIMPVNALRNTTRNKKQKHNHFSLDKFNFNVNLLLSLKSIVNNMRQSFFIIIISALIMFVSGVSAVLYYNLAFDHSVVADLLGKPEASATITLKDVSDKKKTNEIIKYLKKQKSIDYTVKYSYPGGMKLDEIYTVYVNMTDSYADLKMNSIVEGRFPEKDTEISISVDIREKSGKNIGDKVTVQLPYKGGKCSTYTVVGITQVLGGGAVELTYKGAKSFLGDWPASKICLYMSSEKDLTKIVKNIRKKYPDDIIQTRDEVLKDELGSYSSVSLILSLVIMSVGMFVIAINLIMITKMKMNKEKTYWGILRATGYTTGQLLFQIVFAFMILVICGVVIGTVTFLMCAQNVMTMLLAVFGGILSASVIVNVSFVCVIAVGIIMFALIVMLFLGFSLKRITPYQLMSE